MYTIQPKKIIILNILDILNKYTDAEHPLSQKEIQEKLESEYSMKVERKAVKRNLMDLIDFGYDIDYDESKPRISLNKKTGEYEENTILTNFHIHRTFEDSELRLLIDSIVFSSHIPQREKKELIEKLEGLSNVYFKSRMKYVTTAKSKSTSTNTLFYTIDILDEAISKGKQVKFHYDEYGIDKKLRHRKNAEGNDRDYIINPYHIVATNGRYYLVCNYEKYDNLSHYRIDRISDIEILETPARPITDLPETKDGFDLSKHINEQIFMFSDNTIRTKFIAKKTIINDVIDYFGSDVKLSDETEKTITVTANVKGFDMELWALQFATEVTVVEPKALAEKCKSNILEAAQRYQELV